MKRKENEMLCYSTACVSILSPESSFFIESGWPDLYTALLPYIIRL